MASLVVLILAVGNCCAMARPGKAMAAPAAPATKPIMILRRCDEGGLEEERCDMRYSFRALLDVVLVREKEENSGSLKTSRKTGPCTLPSPAAHASFSPCRFVFLLVLGWRIGFAVRRNNTSFNVKLCAGRARKSAPSRTAFAHARHGIGAFFGRWSGAAADRRPALRCVLLRPAGIGLAAYVI